MKKEDALKELSHITEPEEADKVRNIGAVLAILNGIGIIGAIILLTQTENPVASGLAIGLAIGLGFMTWVYIVVFNAVASIVASAYINARATLIQTKYLISGTKEETTVNNSIVNNSMPLM